MSTRWPLSRKTAPPPRHKSLWRKYAEDAQRPLSCLVFLFPLVAIHEFGTLLLGPALGPEQQLVAQSLIQRVLGWFGGRGSWLPAAALLLTLLAWQVLGGYSWRVRGWVVPLMAVESVVLTVPLFVLARLAALSVPIVDAPDMRCQIVLALGAALYEELVFRLYLMVGLMLMLERVLRVPAGVSATIAVVVSAATFALCHFAPVGGGAFAWGHFVRLSSAGAYLAILFLKRGLGVTAGCHAAFNLIRLAV